MLKYYILYLKNISRLLLSNKKQFVAILILGIFIFTHYQFTQEEDSGKTLKDVAEIWLESDASFQWSPKKNISIKHILKNLPSFQKEVQCPILFNPKHPNYTFAAKKASRWKYKVSETQFWKELENNNTTDICTTIKEKYSFITEPLSLEEFEYPLAYGMLVMKDMRQLTYMLSAFYQPQNAYCIAIDGKAKEEFKNRMKTFQKCFPNIHVFIVTRNVSYCGPEIPAAVLSCVQKLTEMNHPWKYYQYLSGVDLPLKTNLEMVRIFKALNGTFNSNIYDVFRWRYQHKGTPPLPILISSLSATFSRASANVITKSHLVYKLLKFLQKTFCPDESMWAPIAGNPKYLKMPGGFSSKEFLAKINSELLDKSNRTKLSLIRPKNSFQLQHFYISRYQEFLSKNVSGNCLGTFKSGSCVYGVGHLPILLVRPELVAHKLYIDTHPASFFCLYHEIRERALDFENQQNFDASNYENLPQVQLSRGKSINDVKFFF